DYWYPVRQKERKTRQEAVRMNTENQIEAVLLCVYAGILAGFLYEPFGIVRLSVKNAAVRIAADILFGVAAAALFLLVAAAWSLPDFRAYMPAAVLAGFLLYTESLH